MVKLKTSSIRQRCVKIVFLSVIDFSLNMTHDSFGVSVCAYKCLRIIPVVKIANFQSLWKRRDTHTDGGTDRRSDGWTNGPTNGWTNGGMRNPK